jgi:hypothetical protein
MGDPAENPSALTPAAPEAAGPPAPKPRTAMGLIPETVDQAWRLAQIMAASDLVPKQYKDKPSDVMVAMMYGAELGITPAQALTGIAVINGRPGLFGEALLAVIVSSPLYISHDEYFTVAGPSDPNPRRREDLEPEDLKNPHTAAVCQFSRRGGARLIRRQFSIADAQRAHLIGKAGPWTEYPQIMLRMRARMFAARDAFPDLLRGVRAAEELQDYPPAPEPEPALEIRRISDGPPAAAAVDEFLDPARRALGIKPEPERRELEPARVEAVQPFLDGALVHFGSGVRAVVDNLEQAAALGALVGTDQQVRATVIRGATDELILESFVIQ